MHRRIAVFLTALVLLLAAGAPLPGLAQQPAARTAPNLRAAALFLFLLIDRNDKSQDALEFRNVMFLLLYAPAMSWQETEDVGSVPPNDIASPVPSKSAASPAGLNAAPTDGALIPMPLTATPDCSTTKHTIVHPNQRFIYRATDAGAFGNVCGYVFDANTKSVAPIPGSPFRAGGGTRSIAIDPSGTFLYAANQDDNTVSGFSIDPATGSLQAIAGSPFATGNTPRSIVAHPGGRFVYASNNTTNAPAGSISGFAINENTGALTPLPGSPYPAPAGPQGIVADPLGKYVFVAAASIQSYAVDAQTGALTAVGAPVGAFANGIAIDPSGRFVYATANGEDQLTSFAVGPSGALTAIGPAVATGANPLGVAVAPTGRFVYVANLLSDDISGFAIDPETGRLAPLAGFPMPAGNNTYSVSAGGILPRYANWPEGMSFFMRPGISGGYPPYRWSVASGALPPGLSLNATHGGLEGTPTVPGRYVFTAQALDSRGAAASKEYTFDVLTRAEADAPKVREYYNNALGHYFITANLEEAASIDVGNAGPGWERTGASFPAGGSAQVCRFYGSVSPGPNSHFYTIDPNECAALRQLQETAPAASKRWNFESLDFASTPAANGACAAGLMPIYRAYNNGFARGIDSNHRITRSPTAINTVVAQGWISEGVVMCAPAP